MRPLVFVLATLAAVVAARPAAAGFVVEVADVSVLPGVGSAAVDVTIRSDDPAAATPLVLFNFEFRITPVGTAAARLEFVNPQPDEQLASPDYVFAGDSFAATFGVPVGAVSTTVSPADTFTGFDLTASLTEVAVSPSGALLVRLRVRAATLLPPAPGDQFTVELVGSPGTFFGNDADPAVPFTATAGTVTIIPFSVPAPPAIALAATAAPALLAGRLLRRRRRR